MDAIDVVFRLAGAFYVFAGWLGQRAILMDSVLDKALAALSAGRGAKAAWRAEGLAIAEALKAILGAENVRFAEGWETGEGRDA